MAHATAGSAIGRAEEPQALGTSAVDGGARLPCPAWAQRFPVSYYYSHLDPFRSVRRSPAAWLRAAARGRAHALSRGRRGDPPRALALGSGDALALASGNEGSARALAIARALARAQGSAHALGSARALASAGSAVEMEGIGGRSAGANRNRFLLRSRSTVFSWPPCRVCGMRCAAPVLYAVCARASGIAAGDTPQTAESATCSVGTMRCDFDAAGEAAAHRREQARARAALRAAAGAAIYSRRLDQIDPPQQRSAVAALACRNRTGAFIP